MIYSDGIHVVADGLDELHRFCAGIGISRAWFHGVRKRHPHYDVPKSVDIWDHGVTAVRPREVVAISRAMTT